MSNTILEANGNYLCISLYTEKCSYTEKPQWLEYLWDHGNLFQIWVVGATKD